MEDKQKHPFFSRPIVWIIAMLVVAGVIFLSSNSGLVPNGEPRRQSRTYQVVLTSNNSDIVGYDVLLQYNPATTKIGTVTSLVDGFEVVQKKADEGVLAVTSIKLPGEKEGSIFSNTPTLEVPVVYEGNEQIRDIEVIARYEKNSTKMVDSKLNILYQSKDVKILLERQDQ